MDLDRYLVTHQPQWQRLEALHQKGRSPRKLRQGEVAELVQLYRKASADLSYVRTAFDDPPLTGYLSRLVATSASLIYGTRQRTWSGVGAFFHTTFPAAVWRARWFVLVSAALTLLPAVAVGTWLAGSPAAAHAALPDAARQAYLEHDFEAYYASERASQFATHVFTNNIGVGIEAFGGGVLLGIPTVVVLVLNGANIGAAGGLFSYYGESAKFWGLITPHGLLEMTSVIIAGAAGLQLGWSVISPGDQRRAAAMASEGRRAIVLVIGLVLSFVVAGTIEGFVTGQPWPTWLRVGIGLVAEAAFVTYLVVLGRRAHRQGFSGALDELAERRLWHRGPTSTSHEVASDR